MANERTTGKRTVDDRLDAIERVARQHGKDIREIKEAVAILQRDVAAFREEHKRDVEFLRASDALIIKEMREGFTQLRGEVQENFKLVFDHLDGISKQIETLSQEYVALKLQVQRLEERVARLEAERSH